MEDQLIGNVIKVNTNERKQIEYIIQNNNPYFMECGNIKINFIYSKNSTRIEECMLNILKQNLE